MQIEILYFCFSKHKNINGNEKKNAEIIQILKMKNIKEKTVDFILACV